MLTLASLFDGIGGFPLSGVMHGIRPVWAAEIEPFPVLVTHRRFTQMRHMGSVTDIKGDEVEPVDILTFGSPCQDLSVAGKQKGIHEGERSSLFFEAVRIMKEMRQHDRDAGRTGKHVRCRWAVWENVPGAYSSNGGRDFGAVLQALAEVADPDVHVPFPQNGKWQKAGSIVGDGYSIAWRTYDAQYWGVPQRRKRIYLVADFGGERAGEILFEPDSVRGNPEESGEAREEAAEDAQGRAGGSGGAGVIGFLRQLGGVEVREELAPTVMAEMGMSRNNRVSVAYDAKDGVKCLNPWDSQTIQQYDASGVLPALASNSGAGMNRQSVVIGAFAGGRGSGTGGIGYSESVAPTLRATPSGSNQVSDVVYENFGFSKWREGCGTLRASGGDYAGGERDAGGYADYRTHADGRTRRIALRGSRADVVVHDARGNGHGGVAPTLTGDHENRVTDYTAVAVEESKPPRKYIVRRLTPLECCRLQGYTDGWTENLGTDEPSEEEIDFFVEVWARWAAINGTKPKSRKQVIKWLNDPASDSAEYKAYGNSLAIPCSSDVLGRIARFAEGEEDEAE